RWPRYPAAPARPTRPATTSGTTTPTSRGTRSAAIAPRFPAGWRKTSTHELHRRGDDDGHRGPRAGRPDFLLRRHRTAQHGGEPAPPAARAGPGPDLRVRRDRRQANAVATVHWGR